MAFVRVHGLKLANGSWIENAVIEAVDASLTEEQIGSYALGRIYFDKQKNTLMQIVSDGADGKLAKPAGGLEYDPNLVSPILSAATSFQSADELLEAAIIDLQSDTADLRKDADGLRKDADDLRTDVDGLRTDVNAILADTGSLAFTYQSTAPAATHTLAHNLDADFVDVSVWVKDPDTNKYSLDLVNVTEVDKNTVQVSLAADYDIKATVRRANPQAV